MVWARHHDQQERRDREGRHATSVGDSRSSVQCQCSQCSIDEIDVLVLPALGAPTRERGAMPAPQAHPRADVELRLPADGVYVSVVRTTTAGLAARLDFLIDDIEDLRIAVGEACAMVLPEAEAGTDLV